MIHDGIVTAAVVVVEKGRGRKEPLCRTASDGLPLRILFPFATALSSSSRLTWNRFMPLDRRSFKSPPASLTNIKESQAVRRTRVRLQCTQEIHHRVND